MALYDDDDDEPPPKKELPAEVAPPPAAKGAANITMKFLQQQLAQKKTSSPILPTRTAPSMPSVFNLSGQAGARNLNIKAAPKPAFNPVKAMPINDGVALKFLPTAAVEDKVLLFNEVVIENEYQPAVPNDYYEERKRLDIIEAREKAARDIAERLAREHKEEEKKRDKGAAIAPPTMLNEDIKNEEPAAASTSVFKAPTFLPAFTPSFGGKSKGLGIAANIMSKMGYKEGSGLGKAEQGMSTALTVKRVGQRSGQILNETQSAENAKPQGVGTTSMADAMKNSSRVVLLRNMVGRAEVDDDLQGEIHEEMAKYGAVSSVAVHLMPEGTPDEEEVRIFVEFGNVSQAIKAFIVLNGRFFAGRTIRTSFYSQDDYRAKLYDRPV